MKRVSHRLQQKIWDKEHTNPHVLIQMDSSNPSSGVTKFFTWLKDTSLVTNQLQGIEMGCGKGRNAIWLAKQGIAMVGFDFSPYAIAQANKRAKNANINNCNFFVQDATTAWNFPSESFDIGIDCFATTDIESKKGRLFATFEMKRVIRKGGYILVYVMSTDDAYHKEMIKKSPGVEKHTFVHSTGKFEKVFTKEEIVSLYKGLTIVAQERVSKVAQFFGKQYPCFHHWMVLQKN